MAISVTWLGYFLNFTGTNFITKVAQIFGNFWAILKSVTLQVKLLCLDFGQLLGKIGQFLLRTSDHTDGYIKINVIWSTRLVLYDVNFVSFKCIDTSSQCWFGSWR